MLTRFSWTCPEDQPFLCHPGTQSGTTCSFKLLGPPRTKYLPYAYLLSIDTLGDCFISIHYTFADVDLSLRNDFPGRLQFLDDLSAFRVACVLEGPLITVSIHLEAPSEKPERF